jgi:hypothetical protein
LLRGEFIESREDTRVAGSAIIEESTADWLDPEGAVLVEKRGLGKWGRVLWLAWAVDGFDPLVQRMLFLGWWGMVEFFEVLINVIGHGDIDIAFVVVPIEGKAAVKGAGPVDGELIVGFDCVD